MRKIILMIIIITNICAWEVTTHRAIDRKALENEKTENLKNFIIDSGIAEESYRTEMFDGYNMTYIDYIKNGEKNGMSALKPIFDDAKYQSLIEAGTMLEDAQWPHYNLPEVPDIPYLPEIPNVPEFVYNKYDKGDGRFFNHYAYW